MIKKDIKGITMIEILVVVAIIALLAIITIPQIISKISSGHDARRKSDLNDIKKAFEEYYTDKDCYPDSLPACNPGDALKPYLPKIPCDPKTRQNYVYYPEPGASCPSWYWVFSELDSLSDLQSEQQGCESGCGPTEDTTYYEYYQSSGNADKPFVGTQGGDVPPEEECDTGYYGCNASGVCIPICFLDGQPECSPNYTVSNCNNRCNNPANQCI